MIRLPASGPVLALVLGLSGCSGAMVADLYPGIRVDVDGAAFLVEPMGTTAVVRNFETAPANQQRLRLSAARAAEIATGCTAVTLTQDPMRNLYDVQLDCRATGATAES